MKNRRALLAVLTTAALASAALASGCVSIQWTDLVSDSGGFRVRMPAGAEHGSTSQMTDDGRTIVQHYVLAEYHAAAFVVMWRDFDPKLLAQVTARDVLEASVSDSWQPEHQQLAHVEKIEIGRYPGRAVRIVDPGNKAVTQMRTYLVKARIYTVLATTHQRFADDPQVQAFLSSFELL